MQSPPRTELAIAVGRVRTIVMVRWLGALFALFQVLTYRQAPYPRGHFVAALVVVTLIALSNVGFEIARRRVEGAAAVRRLALVVLVTDVLTLSALIWVYAFDDLSALFAILFLLPIEGAVVFGLPGAMWTWGAVAVLYLGREWFGTRYANPFEFESVTFRTGLIGIVALIVGLLVRDLVEQRQATAAALEEAQQVEASRSRLISMLAHDVRAPIAAARSALDTLQSAGDRLAPEQREQVLLAGSRQADRALLLTRDLLDLARVEAGTLAVERVDVVLAEVVERVRSVLGHHAELRTAVDGIVVRADPMRLEQVLFNLVDNAVKHGAEPIEVTAERVGEVVEVCVRDHGGGVPDGVELFTAFSHAGEGSVGLGMWIVRQLVEAMDGTVEHRPAEPGACFTLRLPAGGDTGPAAQWRGMSSSSESGTTSPLSRS